MGEYTYNSSNDLIPEMDLEVFIENIDERETKNGYKHLSIMFRVRQDVDQKYKNKVLFDDIWQERDTNKYNTKRLNQLLGTQKIEDGTTFENIQKVREFLMQKCLKIHIIQSYDEYREKDINRVYYYRSTDCPREELQQAKELEKAVEIEEDSLPF